MTKIAILSDLHFGVRNNSSFFFDKMKEFFNDTFFPYIEKNKINNVWMLGDIFDNRKQINFQILKYVNTLFKEFVNKKINVICISGNHDIYYKNTNIIDNLKTSIIISPYIKLINDYEIIEYSEQKIGFINWIPIDKKSEYLNWIEKINVPILCGHFDINDFEMMKGLLCKDGLSPNIFEKFDRVFSGHFHIRASNKNIYYMGNPYQTRWDEYGYKKGFHIFDLSTNLLTFIPNPIDIYQILIYNDNFNINDIQINYEKYKNCILKIIIDIPNTKNYTKLNILIEKLQKICYLVEIVEETIYEDANMVEICENITNIPEIIMTYIKDLNISYKLDKQKLNILIKDLYISANELNEQSR